MTEFLLWCVILGVTCCFVNLLNISRILYKIWIALTVGTIVSGLPEEES